MKLPFAILDTFDLNEKDTQVYIDLLQHGSAVVSTVAARTSIDRTTTYAVLKRLMQKGFVVKSPRKEHMVFSAVDPMIFEAKIKNEIEEKQTRLEMVSRAIPELRLLQGASGSRPMVEIFEGASGVKSLYELMLKNDSHQDAFLTIHKLPPSLKSYLTHEYIQHKIEKNVHSNVLVEDSERARRYQMLDGKANRVTKCIPQGTFPFETEIIIGATDEIAIVNFQTEIIGVMIKSSAIRNTLKAIFDALWQVY